MIITVNMGKEPPDYIKTVGRFLDNLADRNVQSIALVALCDDGHDVCWYNADCLDIKRMAGVLDLAAVRRMIEEDNYEKGQEAEA